MPKEKLKFTDPKEYKKFMACAKLSGVNVGEAFKSAGEIHQEINYRSGLQLIELGGYMKTITDKDVEAYEARVKAKKETAKKPAGSPVAE